MRREIVVLLSALAVLTVLLWVPASQGGIVGSRHDLSSSGEQVCIYCHTPHHASTDPKSVVPLWNRALSQETFTLYSSPTLNATTAQPLGVSLACLSCHDGVVSYVNYNGNSVSTKHDLLVGPGGKIPDTTSYPNCERCHTNFYGNKRTLILGTDLRNDHPISFTYNGDLATADGGLVTPADDGKSVAGLPLYSGKVECPSCHNVHNPVITPFLRNTNAGSALCKKCHIK